MKAKAIIRLLPIIIHSQLCYSQIGEKINLELANQIPEMQLPEKVKEELRRERGKKLPSIYSIKKYAPIVGNQGSSPTCAAWCNGYSARSISYNAKRGIIMNSAKYSFAPGFLYQGILGIKADSCKYGIPTNVAMTFLKDIGIDLYYESSTCSYIIDSVKEQRAKQFKIDTFYRLNENYYYGRKNGKYSFPISNETIRKIKYHITQRNPVEFSLKWFKSLYGKKDGGSVDTDGVWNPSIEDSPFIDTPLTHAVCIVGYNENSNDSFFEVMNSWDTTWGKNGFGRLSYEQCRKYGVLAFAMADKEYTPPIFSGQIEFISPEDGSIISSKTEYLNSVGNATQIKYKIAQKLSFNDPYKIKFKTDSACYIYIFSKNICDDTTVFYAGYIDKCINGEFVNISPYALDLGCEKEVFCVLISKSEINYLPIVNSLYKSNMSVFKSIECLDERLLKKNDIFKKDKIEFQTRLDNESIICFFVEMN